MAEPFTEPLAAPTKIDADPAPDPGATSFLTSLLVVVVVLAGIELFYRDSPIDLQLRKGSGHLATKELEYAQIGGDIVTTGNSRMYHAIRPQVMTDELQKVSGKSLTVYNFGIPSGSPPMFLMIADAVAHHKPPPKLFVLGVAAVQSSCCEELATAGAPFGMNWSAVPYFVKAAWWASPEDAGLAVFLGASRLLSGRAELLTSIHELQMAPETKFMDRGYWSMGGRVSPAQQDVRAKGRSIPYADAMDKSKGAHVHVVTHRYYAQAIELLQRVGTKVVILGSPQARQLDWYHDDKHTYAEYLAEMKKLSDTYGVPFIDMNDPPVIKNEDFVDGDHLSDPGAEIFSKYLADELAKYIP